MTSPTPATVGVELHFPNKPTNNRGLTRVVLRPGHVDADTREFFTAGCCHMLAGALHELTGWPLIALHREHDDHWLHVGVETPDGRFLDINGPRPVAEMRSRLATEQGDPIRTTTHASLSGFAHGIGMPDDWTWRAEIADRDAADAITAMADALLEQVPTKRSIDERDRRTPTNKPGPSTVSNAAGLDPHVAALSASAHHLGDINTMLERIQAQMTQHDMGAEVTGTLDTARDANIAAAQAMRHAAEVSEQVNREVQEAYKASRGQAASKEYQQSGR